MKTKILFAIQLVLFSLSIFSSGFPPDNAAASRQSIHRNRIINSSDSIIVDLSNATITATYIDVPLYIKSDDAVFSFDFAMQFNLSKLSYSTTFNLLPLNTSIVSSAFFNSSDLFLRYTSTSQQSYPTNGEVFVMKIRFTVVAPCTPVCAGDFTNVLTILNGTQCPNRIIGLNFALYVPNANFFFGPSCVNEFVQFSDSSKVSRGTITTWSWNFGGGVLSNLQNNLMTYTASGTTGATLIASTDVGCKDTVVKVLNVDIPPVSGFTYTFSCIKDSVFFTNTSTILSGSVVGSLWYFGDQSLSNSSSLTNPSHHYAGGGFYKVKLTSVSGSNCRSSITQMVSLRPADINGDGVVNVNDFLIFAPSYGSYCD